MSNEEEKDRARIMNTEEFNAEMKELTNTFIDKWFGLVDTYCKGHELIERHKLLVLFNSHLGLERVLSDRVWEIGSIYMSEFVRIAKELIENAH